MIETYYTIPDLAPLTGFSQAFIRAACNRAKGFHPLPHVKAGAKRPILRISLADWNKWLEEEKQQ